jgi:RNA polymerase sigma factor (sigma-70 family)
VKPHFSRDEVARASFFQSVRQRTRKDLIVTEQRDRLLALLETSGARLLGLLTRLTLRPDVAEDLLQELFIKLDRSQGLAGVKDLTGYALRAAVHLAFDWRQERKKLPQAQALRVEPAASTPGPLADVIRREELERVLAALDTLPQQSRDCVVLHYVQDWSHDDIALHLGKTAHQVRGLCYKGIVYLRRLLVPDQANSEAAQLARLTSLRFAGSSISAFAVALKDGSSWQNHKKVWLSRSRVIPCTP